MPHGILLVDDNPDFLSILEDEVKALGAPVFTANAPSAALKLIERGDITVLVTDFVMPEASGGDLIAHARLLCPALQTIIVTGYAPLPPTKRAPAGVLAVLEKPLDMERFLAILAEALASSAGSTVDSGEAATLLASFLEEAREHLDGMDDLILAMDGGGEPESVAEAVNALFRRVHTIKGSAGAVAGTEQLRRVAHSFETLLNSGRQAPRIWQATDVDRMLEAADTLKRQTQDLENGRQPAPADELIDWLLSAANADGPPAKAAEDIGWGVFDDEVTSPAPRPMKAAIVPTDDLAREVSVSNEKLDSLMEISGEMIAFKNNFEGVITSLHAGRIPSSVGISELSKSLTEITDNLQKRILEVRKVKVAKALSSLPRVVRQVASDLGKEITLEMTGQEAEVDKTIARCFSNALIHIVRNACDHGIEMPDVRRAAGKPRKGRITLAVKQHVSNVEVTVEDDGGGLDLERVLRKAVDQKLISAERATTLSPAEIHELLFLPGFSTAAKVTDISGRGVGMDVVRNAVRSVGGTVTIESEARRYTRLTIVTPQVKTVLIEKLFICQSSGFRIALPSTAVASIVRVKERDLVALHADKSGDGLSYDGHVIPCGSYAELTGATAVGTRSPDGGHLTAIIRGSTQAVALRIENLQEQIKAVVKPFDKYVLALPGMKGTALLPENHIAMVLDADRFLAATLANYGRLTA